MFIYIYHTHTHTHVKHIARIKQRAIKLEITLERVKEAQQIIDNDWKQKETIRYRQLQGIHFFLTRNLIRWALKVI